MLPSMKNDLVVISSAFTKKCAERFGTGLLGIYFYGSSTAGDFTVTSDYDFVAVVREVYDNTLEVVEDILEDVRDVPGSDKLEGGFHIIVPDDPWRDTMGIWVDKGLRASKCKMHIEHDSVFAICASGKHCYGVAPSKLLPKIMETELIQFEKNYISEFNNNIPRRSESAQRLYSALLNACRSVCYVMDKKYMTKTQAAERICMIIPELKETVGKALRLRLESEVVSVTCEDIESCKKTIELLKKHMEG